MDRLLVALLSAFDALIAAAVGLAVVLAPLTLVWVIALGGSADWSALWPASGSVWQLGNLVPLAITLDDLYVAEAGIDVDAAAFTLSLAPLAFAAFTAVFAARSGARAAGAGAWITGVVSGALVFGAIATAVALTTANPIARPTLWQAVLLPVALYGVSALCGAIAVAWRSGDDGVIDALRRRLDPLPDGWGEVPGLIARGTAIAVAALVAAASVTVAVAVLLRGGEVIALYESTHLDALGATVVTLGQLAYLPTLVVWALSWLAGPGFAIGVGTAVSPAGTQLGVLPGIPALGLIPEQGSEWLLLALLVPVAAGAVAGWAIRSRLVASRAVASVPAPRAELSGLVPTMPLAPPATSPEHEPIGPRLAVATGIGVFAGAFAALLAWAASGSLGPGRLSEVGPAPGHVALAVGLEVLVGAAILLLGPQAGHRQKEQKTGREERNRLESEQSDAAAGDGMAQRAPGGLGDGIAQPAPAVPLGSDETSAIVDAVATDKGAKTEKPAKPTTARKPDADPWALLSKSKAARTRDAGASSPATPDEKAPVD